MNETVADGIGDYKLKRSGEPTGFMKRFKETPLVIVASRARTCAKNVHCGGEMIYYRPGEPKEIQTKPQGDASS